jgi:hypothetical protein
MPDIVNNNVPQFFGNGNYFSMLAMKLLTWRGQRHEIFG